MVKATVNGLEVRMGFDAWEVREMDDAKRAEVVALFGVEWLPTPYPLGTTLNRVVAALSEVES